MNEKLSNVYNIQCLSATVYKKNCQKKHKICNKYVEFTPHPKSLNGISKLLSEKLTRLGFNDINTTLVNAVEALENAPTKGLGQNNINKMVENFIFRRI